MHSWVVAMGFNFPQKSNILRITVIFCLFLITKASGSLTVQVFHLISRSLLPPHYALGVCSQLQVLTQHRALVCVKFNTEGKIIVTCWVVKPWKDKRKEYLCLGDSSVPGNPRLTRRIPCGPGKTLMPSSQVFHLQVWFPFTDIEQIFQTSQSLFAK